MVEHSPSRIQETEWHLPGWWSPGLYYWKALWSWWFHQWPTHPRLGKNDTVATIGTECQIVLHLQVIPLKLFLKNKTHILNVLELMVGNFSEMIPPICSCHLLCSFYLFHALNPSSTSFSISSSSMLPDPNMGWLWTRQFHMFICLWFNSKLL